ncbi:MAG: TerB family tellurite resistance protein, partial [Planctomycetota bacterium]
MGGLIVTILIGVSAAAVLAVVGLVCIPKFAALVGCSKFSNDLKMRIIKKLVAVLDSEERGNSSYVVDGKRRESPLKPAISKVVTSLLGEENLMEPVDSSGGANMGRLNCRVRIGREVKDGLGIDTFGIEICGTIRAPNEKEEAVLKVTIYDVTGPEGSSESVLAKSGQWRLDESGQFCYSADLGRLTGRETVLSNWTNVGKIQADWLLLPRKGERDLQLRASILSRESSEELASAHYVFAYDNDEFGYRDLDDNRQRSRTLAVALAFTVSASDGKMFKSEVDLIKDWARRNVCSPDASSKAKRELEKALDKTFAFFQEGHQLNTFQICKELVDIAPLGGRLDIMELCLKVVQAKGSASAEELAVLKDLSEWLELDSEHYREMAERILPVNMHEI